VRSGHHLVQAPGGDHDAAAVLAQVAGQPAQALHPVQQQGGARRLGIHPRLAQQRRRVRSALVALPAGEQLGQLVDAVRVQPQHLAHLAHGRARAVADHRGGHAGAVGAVLGVDVLDDLLARVARREVQVDVGPLAALLREETLEEQLHADRIDGGDAERVADGAVGGRAAPLTQDPFFPRMARHVPHDQEVAGQLELPDHRQLVLQLGAHARRQGTSVAAARALEGQAPQQPLLGLVARRVVGEAVAQVGEAEVAALGDLAGGAQPGRAVGEARGHGFGRAQVAFAVGLEPAAGAVQHGLVTQAGEDVVQAAVSGPRVAHVAAGDDRHAQRLG
jgi:hypothetical protein